MCLLFGEQLPDRQRQILIQRVLVGRFGVIFARFCRRQQGVISTPELGLQVCPGAMQRPACRAGIVHIAHTRTMQLRFEIGPKTRALQAFRQEIALQGVVLEVFAKCRQTPSARPVTS